MKWSLVCLTLSIGFAVLSADWSSMFAGFNMGVWLGITLHEASL